MDTVRKINYLRYNYLKQILELSTINDNFAFRPTFAGHIIINSKRKKNFCTIIWTQDLNIHLEWLKIESLSNIRLKPLGLFLSPGNHLSISFVAFLYFFSLQVCNLMFWIVCYHHRVIKSRRLRWAGHVTRMEEGRSAFKILTGKPTGKRPLGRPRRRWQY